MPATTERASRTLELTRTFDAPRDLVWKAWTDVRYLAQWWGPHGFYNPVCEADVRPGGKLRIDMMGPDGTVYPSAGTFEEVDKPKRLSFRLAALDANGTPMFENLNIVEFAESRGKTTINLSVRVLTETDIAEQYLKGMQAGWSQSLERLVEVSTPTAEREIIATRLLAAPRDLVYSMWTDPKHVAKWFGPNGFTMTIDSMDVQPGGTWNFILHGPDGRDYKNRITYVELARPERLVYTHDSTPKFHVTVKFEEEGPYTRITMRSLFESVELRDNTVKTFGAVKGMHETLGRLEKEIATMKPFIISRTFDAPRELMWKAWTEQDRLARWFGPAGAEVVHSKNDLRAGGTYHYAMKASDGGMIWGKWVYREIAEPERLVFVSSFSDENAGVTRHPMAPAWPLETLSTISFNEERTGKTTVTVEWLPLNATDEERAAFEAGRQSMNGGWTGTFNRLEGYLGKEGR